MQHQCFQFLLLWGRRHRGRGLHRGGKALDDVRIDGIRLGPLPAGLGKGADARGQDDAQRIARVVQELGQGTLIAPRGLHHYLAVLGRPQELWQFDKAFEVIGQFQGLAVPLQLEGFLGKIHARVQFLGIVRTHTCKCEPRPVHPAALNQRFEFGQWRAVPVRSKTQRGLNERLQSADTATVLAGAGVAAPAPASLSLILTVKGANKSNIQVRWQSVTATPPYQSI